MQFVQEFPGQVKFELGDATTKMFTVTGNWTACLLAAAQINFKKFYKQNAKVSNRLVHSSYQWPIKLTFWIGTFLFLILHYILYIKGFNMWQKGCFPVTFIRFFHMYDLEISNIIHGFESIDFVGKTQNSKKKDALYSRTCKCQLRIVHFWKCCHFFLLQYKFYLLS